jgi:hypothetical protein
LSELYKIFPHLWVVSFWKTLLMLQLSSLATYINNTESLRVGGYMRGYVIDCRHVPIVSIHPYQKMFCGNYLFIYCFIHVFKYWWQIMHSDSCIDCNGHIMCVKYFYEGCTDYDELS